MSCLLVKESNGKYTTYLIIDDIHGCEMIKSIIKDFKSDNIHDIAKSLTNEGFWCEYLGELSCIGEFDDNLPKIIV